MDTLNVWTCFLAKSSDAESDVELWNWSANRKKNVVNTYTHITAWDTVGRVYLAPEYKKDKLMLQKRPKNSSQSVYVWRT